MAAKSVISFLIDGYPIAHLSYVLRYEEKWHVFTLVDGFFFVLLIVLEGFFFF